MKYAKEWVAALRSGKYKQAQEILRDDKGGYCCLGVLCEVLVEKGIVVRLPEGNETSYSFYASVEGNELMSTNLGSSLLEIIKLPVVIESILTMMNDGVAEFQGNPQSHAQIADYVERELTDPIEEELNASKAETQS